MCVHRRDGDVEIAQNTKFSTTAVPHIFHQGLSRATVSTRRVVLDGVLHIAPQLLLIAHPGKSHRQALRYFLYGPRQLDLDADSIGEADTLML
jgi:hypothetical protein